MEWYNEKPRHGLTFARNGVAVNLLIVRVWKVLQWRHSNEQSGTNINHGATRLREVFKIEQIVHLPSSGSRKVAGTQPVVSESRVTNHHPVIWAREKRQGQGMET